MAHHRQGQVPGFLDLAKKNSRFKLGNWGRPRKASFRVFLRSKSSPSLILNKIEHFSKVSKDHCSRSETEVDQKIPHLWIGNLGKPSELIFYGDYLSWTERSSGCGNG